MTDKLDISQEEVEKMKQKDMLETLLQELAKDYPILSQVVALDCKLLNRMYIV